jgi:small subunit ribosomal protein S3
VRDNLAREREFVEEGIRKADIKEFLRDSLQKAKFGGVDIRRTALRTRMIIYAERPGLIIGRRGRNIKDLTDVMEERYGFENLQIEVEEIRIPELNPHIMASRIAAMLKTGRPFRRSAYMNLSRIMEAGAKGVEIIISGKIRGERSRTVRFVDGAITKCGEPAKQVLEGLAVADLKQGMMGIKVKILPPDARMPDQVDLEPLTEKARAEEAVSEEAVSEEAVSEETVSGEEEAEPKEDVAEETEKAEPEEPLVESEKEVEEVAPPSVASEETAAPDDAASEAQSEPELEIEVKEVPVEEVEKEDQSPEAEVTEEKEPEAEGTSEESGRS